MGFLEGLLLLGRWLSRDLVKQGREREVAAFSERYAQACYDLMTVPEDEVDEVCGRLAVLIVGARRRGL